MEIVDMLYIWRACEACETLLGISNGNRRYMLLASEQSKRDPLWWCSIENCCMSVCIYIYVYLVRAAYFFTRASNYTCGTVSWGSFMTGTCPTILEVL